MNANLLPSPYSSLYARLCEHVVEDPSGCWLWTLRADGRGRHYYPRLNIRVRGRHLMVFAHRAMLVLDECGHDVDIELFFHTYHAYGVARFEADHATTCVSSLCINARHLQWLPREEHQAATRARGQGIYGGKRWAARPQPQPEEQPELLAA